jgi:hypothetical protein
MEIYNFNTITEMPEVNAPQKGKHRASLTRAQMRLPRRLVWDSRNGTYVRAIHGPIGKEKDVLLTRYAHG